MSCGDADNVQQLHSAIHRTHDSRGHAIENRGLPAGASGDQPAEKGRTPTTYRATGSKERRDRP